MCDEKKRRHGSAYSFGWEQYHRQLTAAERMMRQLTAELETKYPNGYWVQDMFVTNGDEK